MKSRERWDKSGIATLERLSDLDLAASDDALRHSALSEPTSLFRVVLLCCDVPQFPCNALSAA